MRLIHYILFADNVVTAQARAFHYLTALGYFRVGDGEPVVYKRGGFWRSCFSLDPRTWVATIQLTVIPAPPQERNVVHFESATGQVATVRESVPPPPDQMVFLLSLDINTRWQVVTQAIYHFWLLELAGLENAVQQNRIDPVPSTMMARTINRRSFLAVVFVLLVAPLIAIPLALALGGTFSTMIVGLIVGETIAFGLMFLWLNRPPSASK